MTDNTQPEALRLAKALEYCDASVAITSAGSGKGE